MPINETIGNDHCRLHNKPSFDNSQSRRDDGFVLIVVLLTLGLLSSLAAAFAITMRTNTTSIATHITLLRAAHAVDAGVQIAALELVQWRKSGDSRLNPSMPTFLCSTPENIAVHLIVESESGKIDLNTAYPDLLVSFFSGAGLTKQQANELVARIRDFRDADESVGQFGAEAKEYASSGLLYGPKNGPFDSVEELDQVLGFPKQLMSVARRFLTVHSGRSGIDLQAASPELLTMISGASVRGAQSIPAQLSTQAGSRIFKVFAVSPIGKGGMFTRTAVVELADTQPNGFLFRSWMREELAQAIKSGLRQSIRTGQARRALPEC